MSGIAKLGRITAQFIHVEPETAARWLRLSGGNRKLISKKVAGMIRDLTNHRFPINGDTIRFNEDGVLVDGHHRLTAIVKSGVGLDVLVVRGLPRAATRTVDQDGTVRPKSVLFALRGEDDAPTLAALVLAEWRFRLNRATATPTATEAVTFLEDNPELRKSAVFGAAAARGSNLPVTARVAAHAHYRLSRDHNGQGEDYITDLFSEEQRKTNPALGETALELEKLRAQTVTATGELTPRRQLALVLDGFEKYRQ